MEGVDRLVFVISDLHLGGVYPEPGSDDERGFRICTRSDEVAAFLEALAGAPGDAPAVDLVLNGDLVDFLAERDAGAAPWVPYTPDPDEAVAKLDTIVERDRAVFEGLGRVLEAGHRLTLLLGNHDIELALPKVRRRLEEHIGVRGRHAYRFIYDGEALVLGDALIEHGNRYDRFNVVDYDGLRRVRSLMSRGQEVPKKYRFEPPAGSRMVAEVVNPIKEQYRFIDLLKPETDGMIPVLLALEPGFRRILARVAGIARQASRHKLEEAALPSFGGDIASETAPAQDFGGDMGGGPIAPRQAASSSAELEPSQDEAALGEVLSDLLGADAQSFLEEIDATRGHGAATAEIGSDISTWETVDRSIGLAKLLFASGKDAVDERLPALLRAVRVLQSERAFDRSVETAGEYLGAAQELARGGIKHVVFGHTHLAKQVELDSGGFYLNSGTWADLIHFPKEVVTGDDETALRRLRPVVEDLAAGRLGEWLTFQPTFARLELGDDGAVRSAEVRDWSGPEALWKTD